MALLAAHNLKLRRKYFSPVDASAQRTIKRWVAPTLKELARRRKRNIEIIPTVHKRSSFTDWNFDSEVYAFDQRLNENFDLKLLAQAFCQRSYIVQEELRLEQLGVDVNEIALSDNRQLAETGRAIATEYVLAFLKYHLPRLPAAGIATVADFLLSVEKLAHIATNLGTKDLIMAQEYPPSNESLATTLLACVGALKASQPDASLVRPYNFVRDFICTHLNQVDITDVWTIEKPLEVLRSAYAEQGVAQIEPRIIGETAKADLLFCCRIALYDSNSKKLLGSSYGETFESATAAAAVDALARLYGISNLRPFDFSLAPDALFPQANQRQIAS